MYRKATALLGAGVLAVGLAAPLSASAHADDNALAFVIGAAVGHALDRDDVRYVHAGRGHGHRNHHPVHRKAHSWHRWDHRLERRFDRRHDRWERRHERDERRHDRHERRHERRDDRRHDRRHHG